MRTQSADTSPEAERVWIAMIRKIPLTKRFDRVRSWTASALQMNRQYTRKSKPNASEEELALIFVTHNYGRELASSLQEVFKKKKPQISDTVDILDVLRPLVDIFERLGIAYYVGGSVASSMYGIVQAAQDIDLIVNLQPEHVNPLLAELQKDYYFDKEAVRDALQYRTFFNVIHLESVLKIDVFLPNGSLFDQQVFQRAQQYLLGENQQPLCMASPEDIILEQLQGHSKGGEVADDKWNDILGVLKVQGDRLNLAYLQNWAVTLGISYLLEKACIDAGLLFEGDAPNGIEHRRD